MPVEMLRLLLELEPGSEPVKGSLALEGGERRGFQGWMELAATLETLSVEGRHRPMPRHSQHSRANPVPTSPDRASQ